jgi:excisionase family DNA binding protein
MTSNDKKAALSISEACNYSGLSRSTLYRLIEAGELPSIKVAGRRLIRPVELDKLLGQASDDGVV